MRRSLPVLAAFLFIVEPASAVWAEQIQPSRPLVQRAANTGSRIVGLVTDQTGRGLGGATVVAMGTTLAMTRSEANGQFILAVPAGEYILRAARDGYVSTYREAVRVQSDLPLQRRITLLKTGEPADQVLLAAFSSAEASQVEPAPAGVEAPSQPSETVWRLRHLPRTVLRDGTARSGADPSAPRLGEDLRADWSRGPSLFSASDLSGHVDFLTTSSLAASRAAVPFDWPRGVAYVVLGAPVGNVGSWTVRAALASGGESAWTLVGEYRAREDLRHAFRTGVTYSAQTLLAESGDLVAVALPSDVRRVGGVYAIDHWTIGRGLEVEYGGRLDRYDYLPESTLLGGSLDVRQHLNDRAAVVISASRQMVAPGADQFQPPAEAGVWLPPERTFGPLNSSQPLGPAETTRYGFALDTVLRRAATDEDTDLTLRLSRFSEQTFDQLTSIFGVDDRSQVAHYYVASPGSVQVDGWRVGLAGQLAPHLRGKIDYTSTRADWTAAPGRWQLRRVAPSVVRRGRDTGHDVTSSLSASLPATATRVDVALRINTAYSRPGASSPGLGSRFAIEISQLLPFQPVRGSRVNLMVAARTLLSDVHERGSYHDDLLTLAPPLRLTCGIQMGF